MPHLPRRVLSVAASLALAGATTAGCSSSGSENASPATNASQTASGPALRLARSAPTTKLDPRFSSYNIEMVTVTGGSFWAPYGAGEAKKNRPPIDLGSTRLRNLAKALGPAYVRVSGTWADSTYFAPDGTAATKPPPGFDAVLTGAEWKGVGDFADAVGDRIVTSYASSPGTLDAQGAWNPEQAELRMQFSKDHDIPVVAAELFNEVSIGVGMPKGYDAARFDHDLATFAAAAHKTLPGMLIVGPSATNDVDPMLVPASIKAPDILRGGADDLDVFSYHVYPKVSQRCNGKGGPATVLKPDNLHRVDAAAAYYEGLREKYVPKAPMWVTETGQAACGGDPWAAAFAAAISYVDIHGRLARSGVDAVFHDTLVGSDYGLLAENSYDPRPTYWAAVLWHRLMGTDVLKPDKLPGADDLTVYAQRTPGTSHGVTYAVINTSSTHPRQVHLGESSSTIYQLTADSLGARQMKLNGKTLAAHTDGTLPSLEGEHHTGPITLPPASVTFIVDS